MTQSTEDSTANLDPQLRLNIDDMIKRRYKHAISNHILDCVGASDPLDELIDEVAGIRKRQLSTNQDKRPNTLELYFAREMEESGLFLQDVDMPRVSLIVPPASNMFYLRVDSQECSYKAVLRILRIESALNRCLLVQNLLEDEDDITMEDCFIANQRLLRSITSINIAGADFPEAFRNTGEWGSRWAIAHFIESVALPFRLTSRFRLNLEGGQAAVEIDYTTAECFPASCFSDLTSKVIPTTRDMRLSACCDYALRLGLLMAKHVFAYAPQVEHVHVASVLDTARRHVCYYSVDFDREHFSTLDLDSRASSIDPIEVFHSFGATMRTDDDRLHPVAQHFSMMEERFCPKSRFDAVELSDAELPESAARALGATHVCDLGINEDVRRVRLSDQIVRHLGTSTQENVRMILEIAGDDPDETVREAAQRVVGHLIDGTLDESDPLAVSNMFVYGGPLCDAMTKGGELMVANRDNAAKVQGIVGEALEPIEQAGTYVDDEHVVWRQFPSFISRVLYNRFHADDTRVVRLVPEFYLAALACMSDCLLEQGKFEEALIWSKRAVQISPFDMRSYLRCVRCLEQLDRLDQAASILIRMLGLVYEPDMVTVAYYRLAFMEWKMDRPKLAMACYHMAIEANGIGADLAVNEVKDFDLDQYDRHDEKPSDAHTHFMEDLVAAGIPLAPSFAVVDIVDDAAVATTNANLFYPAKVLTLLAGVLHHSDVLSNLSSSLEEEPDR